MIIDGPDSVTKAVLSEIERAPDPRFREVMSALVRHLHAFIREVRLTEDEFQQACALHQRDRPEHQRVPQRGGADVGLARRLDPGLPAQQRQQRRDRNHRQSARSVLAAGFAAHRERRLDRALADAGAGAVRQRLRQGPRRQAGRRRRGRRLAVLDRGALREPGPDPGRHEPARQVHHRRARARSRSAASSRPAIRSRSTGRSAICCARRAATTCGRRTCTS